MRRFVAVITAVSFFGACTFSKMAMINSDPTGARLRLGGQDKGATPANMKLGCSGIQSKGQDIELSLNNYRTLKASMEYKTLTSNVVWSILFFWPAIFIWGKCPEDNYSFKLDRAVASLEGKSTLTVVKLESPYPVFVDKEQIVPGRRIVFEAGWHGLNAQIDGQIVGAGEVLLEPSTDHVVVFGLNTKPN